MVFVKPRSHANSTYLKCHLINDTLLLLLLDETFPYAKFSLQVHAQAAPFKRQHSPEI